MVRGTETRFERRRFQQALAAALAGTTLGLADDKPTVREGQTADDPPRDYPAPKFKPKFAKPQIGRTLVQDFVIFAHSDLEMVKKLFAKEPRVLNATMDWGAGDWESALGAAAHMGRVDIADFLLDRGARIDVFAAAMLGQLDAVKALLAARPTLIDAKGPHGIPLLSHAKKGGKNAEPVVEFLSKLAPKTTAPKEPRTQ